MSRAQKLESAAGWSEGSTGATATANVVAEAARAPAELAQALTPRGIRVLLAVQVVTLAALIAGVIVVRDLLIEVRQANAAQMGATQANVEKMSLALRAEVRTVENEVAAVRHLVASSTGEDVIFLKIMVLKPHIDPELARKISKGVHRYSALYKRDPDLVLSIMTVESDFNPTVVSYAGAIGLMQVMPHWKKVLNIQGDMKDPDVSIESGLQVLGFYMEMYKDTELALTAYNRGPGPVDNALVKGRDPGNDYAPRVLKVYEKLKKLSASQPQKI